MKLDFELLHYNLILNRYFYLFLAGSSNGNSTGSFPVYEGSNPFLASCINDYFLYLLFFRRVVQG
jgi:hypothetical protein